jgi:Ran-binding protein 1
MSTFTFKVADKDEEEGGEEGADTVVGGESEEPTGADYAPIIKLNKLEEVITHEEDEDIAHCVRVKLFEYGETLLNQGKGIKEWKEKGIGELKFLKHKTTGKTRILMRQEKTLKICANFYCDHRLPEIKAHNGSDKAWIVSSPADFSDATTPTPRVSKFFIYIYKES